MTNGQITAIVSGSIYGLFLLVALVVVLSAPSPAPLTEPNRAVWVVCGVAWTLVARLAYFVCWLHWKGLSVTECRGCRRHHNINAVQCPFCESK